MTKRAIWPWFLCGFLLTFGVLAATLTTYSLLPSGQGVARVKLWQFYLLELPRLFGPRPLGPAPSTPIELLTTVATHIALAAAGGLIPSLAAWWLRKREHKSSDGT